MEKNLPYAKKWAYTHIFNNEFNIGFFVPKKDQCNTCISFANSTPEDKAALQVAQEKHIERKQVCREMKHNYKESAKKDNEIVCAVYVIFKRS